MKFYPPNNKYKKLIQHSTLFRTTKIKRPPITSNTVKKICECTHI